MIYVFIFISRVYDFVSDPSKIGVNEKKKKKRENMFPCAIVLWTLLWGAYIYWDWDASRRRIFLF
jgi:hypothetical protein